MARYKARYEFEGARGNMNFLEPGDVLELDDGTVGEVRWSTIYNKQRIYEIEGLGVVYARELIRGWK